MIGAFELHAPIIGGAQSTRPRIQFWQHQMML